MAFPVVASTSSGNTQSGTGHGTELPAGVQAGDLLIMLFTRLLATTTTWPPGWTSLVSNTANMYGLEVRYRVATGGDTAPTLTTGNSNASAYRCLRITGAEPTSPPVVATATGTSTAPNSPALNPAGWDVEDTRWLSVASWNNDASTSAGPSAYPANYSGGFNAADFGPVLAYASRNLAAASEDPGAYTAVVSVTWFAATIAVRPMIAVAASATLTATSTLTAAGVRQQTVATTLAAGSSLGTATTKTQFAATDLTADSTLTAAGTRVQPGGVTMAGHTVLTTTVFRTQPTTATAAATSSLAVAGTRVRLAAVSMAAGSSMEATAVTGASLPGLSVLTVTATQAMAAVTELAASSALADSALLVGQAEAALSATSNLVSAVTVPAGVGVAAVAVLELQPWLIMPSGVALVSHAALTDAPAVLTARASVALTATSALDTTGPFLAQGGTGTVIGAVSALTANAVSFVPVLVVPAGPVVVPTVTPVYRLYAADTRSGRIGWELPFDTVAWNNPINAPGTLRASLVIEDALDRLRDQGELDPRSILREVLRGPYRFSLVLAWGNTVVFAGPYLPGSIPGDTPTVDVGAAELARLFDKRVLADPTQTLYFGPTSPSGMVKAIIDHAIANTPTKWWRQGRELPITCTNPPPTSGSVTRVFNGFDMTKASEALAGVTADEDGPDYRLDPYLVTGSDGLYVRWELRIGNLHLGTGDPWVFSDSNAVVNQEIDVARTASMLFVPGSGQDEKKLIAWWVDNQLVDQGFPALEDVDGSYSSEIDKALLNSYGRASLARYTRPVDQWTVRVRADTEPGLGTYRVADSMLLDIRRHPVIDPGTYRRRITDVSGDATPWVSLTSSEPA